MPDKNKNKNSYKSPETVQREKHRARIMEMERTVGSDPTVMEGINAVSEMNAMLKQLNPSIVIPYTVLAALSEYAAEYLHFEYMAREEDKTNAPKSEEEACSFMSDEELEHLEGLLELTVKIMVRVAGVVTSESGKGNKGNKGGNTPLQA